MSRPPSASKETQRRVTPQNRKTPHYLNSTTSSGMKTIPKTNTAGSRARQLEQTFSAHCTVEKTITNATNATRFSQTLACPGVDWEQECDDAYNNYLQALLKQQIVQMNIARRKKGLSEQLVSHGEPLFKDKIELQCLEMEKEIEEENKKMPESVQLLKEELDEFKRTCEEYKIEQLLDRLNELFSRVKDRVTLEDILPFRSQEQYDKLTSQLESMTVQLGKILKQTESEAKLDQLAQQLQSVLCLKEEIVNKEMQMEQYDIKQGFLILKKLSDYFARMKAVK